MAKEITDTYKHAKYYSERFEFFRIESNCPDFLKTGKSPKKLLYVEVEWEETYILEDGEHEPVRLGRHYRHPVHARSLVIALATDLITSLDMKKNEFEIYEGNYDLLYMREMMEEKNKNKIAKVIFGSQYHSEDKRTYRLQMHYEFDFS